LWSWFFCHGTAPAELYPLSLHDALPICERHVPLETEVAHLVLQGLTQLAFPEDEQPRIGQFACDQGHGIDEVALALVRNERSHVDRKSTRLNSSHVKISYAVFCLKKKK